MPVERHRRGRQAPLCGQLDGAPYQMRVSQMDAVERAQRSDAAGAAELFKRVKNLHEFALCFPFRQHGLYNRRSTSRRAVSGSIAHALSRQRRINQTSRAAAARRHNAHPRLFMPKSG